MKGIDMSRSTIDRIFHTDAPPATLLIRLAVGGIFLSEGIQKFLYPGDLGAGRFAKMGFAGAEWLAPFVGCFEILCGALILAGLATRLASIPITIIMTVAILTTKIPILLGRDLGPFKVRQLDEYGFWSMAHEMRTDFAMLTGALFLLWVGGGLWSADGRWFTAASPGQKSKTGKE